MTVSPRIHRKNHHAGGVHVQTVDDTRLRIDLLRACLQAIRVFLGLAGNAQQTGWLVDHKNVVIGMQHIQKRIAWRTVDEGDWRRFGHEPLITSRGPAAKQKARTMPAPSELNVSKPLTWP